MERAFAASARRSEGGAGLTEGPARSAPQGRSGEIILRYAGPGYFYHREGRRLSVYGQALLRVNVAVTEFGEVAFTHVSRGA